MSIVSRTSPPFGDRGQATAYIGETVNAGFRLQQPDGAGGWELQDYSGRVFGLRVYSDGGTTLVNVLGTLTAHADGAYIACNIPGTTTDDLAVGLYGWEFVEFVADGRIVIAGGPFKVATASAAAQASGSSGTSSAGSTVYTLRTDLGIVAVNYMGAPGYSVPTGGTVGQYVRKSSSTNYDMAWDTITSADVSGLDAQLAALQAADADLAVIAALTPSNDDLLQRKAGAWANRTPAQVKTDLALVKGDVGLGNVDNTSDANKPVSTAQQAALDLKLNLAGGTLSGVLAFIAGTAALPGLAVAGDLNTGIYGVSADVLGVSAGGTARVTVSASGLMPFADATYDLGAASTRFYAGLFSNSIKIGGAAPAGAASLSSIQSFGSNWSLIGGDVLTDATTKRTRQGYLHYLAAEEPVTVYLGYADATQSIVSFGGGTSSGNAATRLEFWTAANNSTITGTQRWFIDSAGFFYAATDNSYDIGSTSSARPRNVYVGTKVAINNATLGSQALDVYTGSAGTLAAFQSNGVAAGNTLVQVVVGNAVTGTVTPLRLSGEASASLLVDLQNNHAGDGTARYRALVLGTGDPYMHFEVNGVTSWSAGLDNSDSDSYKISQGGSLGTNDRLTILTSGEVGLGTTSPASLLHLRATSAPTMRLDNGTTSTTSAYQFYSGSSLEGGMSHTANTGLLTLSSGRSAVWGGKIIFEADTLERMRISSTAASLSVNAIFATDNTYDFGAASSARARSIYAGTNVVIGYSTTSSAALHVGPGTALGLPNGAGTVLTPQVINSQTTGTAFVGAAVNDGTNNHRAGLFVDNTNGLWGLSARTAATAAPFIIYNNGAEHFRLTNAGVATLYNNLLFGTDNSYDFGAVAANRPRSIYAGTAVYTGTVGTTGATALGLVTDGTTRFYISGSSGHLLANVDNTYDFGASGANRVRNAYIADSVFSTYFRFPSSTRLTALSDGGLRVSNNAISNFAILEAEAANTLALRNGTNAQIFRIYETYTDASNYARFGFQLSGSTWSIGPEGAGTGSAGKALQIYCGGTLTLQGGGTNQWQINGGSFIPVADATRDIGTASQQIRDAYLSRYLRIGGAAPAGASGLATVQAFGSAYALIGGDGLTDATTKNTRIGGLHYTAAEKPVAMMIASAGSSSNTLSVGGGTSSANAATQINFFTGATNTTPTGTTRLQIDSAGHVVPGADATYKLGDNAAQFIDAYLSRSVLISQAAIPAGGVAGRGVRFSSTANFGVFFGSGAPTLSAAKGSFYMRSDGSTTNDRAYVNTDGGTTWTPMITAA